jgi:hypothetical protein
VLLGLHHFVHFLYLFLAFFISLACTQMQLYLLHFLCTYLFFFFISIPIDAESSASAVVVFLLFHSFTRLFTCVLFILFLL